MKNQRLNRLNLNTVRTHQRRTHQRCDESSAVQRSRGNTPSGKLRGVVWFAFLVLLGGVGGIARQAAADDAVDLLTKEQDAFTAAVQRAAACVVQIETFGGLERVGDELLAEGPTTGTIVGAEGWIVSSLYSFRQQPASILVTLPSGQRAAARMVARDFSREIALLKVESQEPLPIAIPADLAQTQVGQWSVALGKTYDADSVSQSVGIISALGRAYGRAVQTDAKVSPINYGGPLIDLQGRVIGILAPISPGTFFESNSAQLYDSGIGFAIPLNDILDRIPKLQMGVDIYPGKLGEVPNSPNELAGPVRLTGVTPGSPAAKAGIRAGDVIVEAGGRDIRILADLRHAQAGVDAGQVLRLGIERQGQRLQLECELVEEIPIYRRRYVGLRLAEVDDGLKITRIEADSPAERTGGLVAGERIAAVNGQAVSTREEFAKLIAVAELDTPLLLQVVAGDAPPREVELSVGLWPAEIVQSLPEPIAEAAGGEAELIELPLGDLPNVAFAVKSPGAGRGLEKTGLLIIFPEPGEVDRKKTMEQWTKFCTDYGWMVVVIQSANPRAWTMEEVELAGRVIGRLDKSFPVDATQTVIAGWGVGGRLALTAAVMERQRVQGTLTLGTELKGLSLRTANAPLQSLDFLFVGEARRSADVVETLQDKGYSVQSIDTATVESGKWETLPMETITRWLLGLSRL